MLLFAAASSRFEIGQAVEFQADQTSSDDTKNREQHMEPDRQPRQHKIDEVGQPAANQHTEQEPA